MYLVVVCIVLSEAKSVYEQVAGKDGETPSVGGIDRQRERERKRERELLSKVPKLHGAS